MQMIKRKLMMALLLLPLASALIGCKAATNEQGSPLSPTQRRFDKMGLTLVVDAVEGAEMLGVEFFADGSEFPFYASSVTKKANREIMSFPSGVVPERVRVVWRVKDDWGPFWWSNPQAVDDFGRSIPNYLPPMLERPLTWTEMILEKVARRKLIAKNVGHIHQGPWAGQYFGEIIGDYTFHLASRIPDDVVREIRKNGGGLRLKFRLKPDGVLFGWDIERFSGGMPVHSMPGGDFLETWY